MTLDQTTDVPALPRSLDPNVADRRGIALLCAAHLFNDVNQGSLPAMLPFFMEAHDLSYSAAAGLMLAITASSSFLQPLLGQLSDRRSAPWLVFVGLLCSGGGLALSTIMPSYLLIALAVGISGFGVAAFHPEAARFANRAAGARRATGLSFFTLGGNLGFAVGPLISTPVLLALGLQGGVFLAVPAAIMALILAKQTPRFVRRARQASSRGAQTLAGTDAWGPFLRLTGAVVGRSIVFYGLYTFLPLHWRDDLHQPVTAGSAALTLMSMAGSLGTVVGGWCADRYGRRRVILSAMGALSVLLLAFVSVEDPTIALALLVPIGMMLFAPHGVMVVMGQEYLPNRVGTASGVTMGLAISIGGFAAPFLGRIADSHGIAATLPLLVFIPLLSVAFAATLPERGRATA